MLYIYYIVYKLKSAEIKCTLSPSFLLEQNLLQTSKNSTLLFAVTENTKDCQSEEDDATQYADHDVNAHVHFDGGSFHTFKLIVHHLLASSLRARTRCASIRFAHACTNLFIRIGHDALFPPAVDNHLACTLRSIFTD